MDHKALIAQCRNIAQDRAPRRAHPCCKRIDGRGAVAAQHAHDGVMAVSDLHFGSITHIVTIFGTFLF